MTEDRTSTHAGARPAHGTATEEAARLVEELGAWARRVDARRSPDAAGPEEPDWSTGPDGPDRAGGPGTPGGPEAPGGRSRACPEPSTCRVCPLCQGAALLRGLRPEVVEHLAAAATSLAAALREVVAPPQRPGHPPAEPDVEQIRVLDDEPSEPTEPTGDQRDRESTR